MLKNAESGKSVCRQQRRRGALPQVGQRKADTGYEYVPSCALSKFSEELPECLPPTRFRYSVLSGIIR